MSRILDRHKQLAVVPLALFGAGRSRRRRARLPGRTAVATDPTPLPSAQPAGRTDRDTMRVARVDGIRSVPLRRCSSGWGRSLWAQGLVAAS